MSSRRLLPVVVRMVMLAFWPPLAQMPSAPLAHPPAVMVSVTLVRSRLYLEKGSSYHSLLAGVVKLLMGLRLGPATGPKSWLTMRSRSVA